ncbi:MAG TPA: hypothetical protein PLR96_01630 [Flavobacteriales bacterium]|nr:hypothetical protein [Flavobacteriales bacterium]
MRQHRTYPVRAVNTWSLVWCITLSCCIRGACAQFSGGPGAGGANGCLPTMIVLPVSMLQMVASCEDGMPTIRWTTASERNSSHFAIERSADAVVWEAIGEVRAAGHSQQVIEYAWRDKDLSQGVITYYRLRQVDRDGAEEVYASMALDGCATVAMELHVAPNPTEGMVTLTWPKELFDRGPVESWLMDAQGRILYKGFVANADSDQCKVDLSPYVPGTYMLLVTDGGGTRRAYTVVRW